MLAQPQGVSAAVAMLVLIGAGTTGSAAAQGGSGGSPVAPGMSAEGILYAQASRSVLRIEGGLSHGSGFLIDSDGRIVTNDHVVGVADTVSVYIDSVTRVPALVLARDADADLAVLQIAPSLVAGRPPLTLAGAPAPIAPGDHLVVLGYPLSQPLTLVTGLVSTVRRGAFLTDAAINPGNSGGPVLAADGRVVGVATFRAPDASGLGLGLGGAVLVDRVHALLAAALTVSKRPPAPDSRLPTVPTDIYPYSVLKQVADTIDPALFASMRRKTVGPFAVSASTPLSRTLAAITAGRLVGKDRRKREERANVPEEQRYTNAAEMRDWASYVGDETMPVVAIKVEPLYGETGGSSFRRAFLTALVGTEGQATIRFAGDVRRVTLKRNGEVITPLRGGHTAMTANAETEMFDFNDVADFAYQVYAPEVFRPDGPQRPPEISLEIEDLKRPSALQRTKLDPVLVARLWNDFEAYYRLQSPAQPFLRIAVTLQCTVDAGATAMSGVAPRDRAACQYIVTPPPR